MKHAFFLFLVVTALSVSAAMKGPYRAEGLAFFIVHEGGPLKIETKLQSVKQKKKVLDSAVVLRIFDAEEKEVLWKYVKFSGEKSFEHDFGANAPKGIYQVRASGKNYTLDPVVTPEKKYGVMAPRSRMRFGVKNQFEDVYFLIPEGSKSLNFRPYSGPMKITPQGEPTVTVTHNKTYKADLTGKAGQVWHLSFKNGLPADFSDLHFNGIPVILCPDPETAKAINGSIEKAPDGTIYAHKFQLKMHNWVKSLKPEDLKVDMVDLRTLEAQFRAEPQVRGLIGPWGVFSYINYQLKSQNLDPASPKYGDVPGGSAGLAVANSLKKPFNPYAGKLEKRLILAEFQKYLKMKESETWRDISQEYCGDDALMFSDKGFPFYYGINSIQDPELKQLWAEGYKRFIDRFCMFRVSCENQSSHYLFYLQAFGETMNNDSYKELAADFVHGMDDPKLNPFIKTGYHQERGGPDVTYSGLGQSWQALYYRMSGNKEALEGCRRVHNFFAHSCAREPDGTIVGSSSFAHRTRGGWTQAQYGAGRGFLQAEVEEAAAFTQEPKENPVDFKRFLNPDMKGNNAVMYATKSFGPYMNLYLFPTKRMKNPRLPFEKKEAFTKNFNNEFLAVRKPGYYSFTYLNGTAQNWIAGRRPKTVKNPKTSKWTALQGLALLWFKDYGAFVVGRAHDGNAYQILRGDLPDGKMAYPDYWAHKAVVNGDNVKATGKLFQANGVTYTRTTESLENGIRQTLEVKFAKDITFKSLVEQIPFYEAKKNFKIEYHVNGKWDTKPGMADAVRFCGKIMIRLDKAYFCEQVPSEKPYGTLRIELGKKFKAGSSVKLSYTIQPE